MDIALAFRSWSWAGWSALNMIAVEAFDMTGREPRDLMIGIETAMSD
jgi:hypothetical protein